MSYEVFARKYRPQTFDDLVGQTHVARTLKNAVAQNRLARCYANGAGVETNLVEAAKWHLIAKAAGETDANLDKIVAKLSKADRAKAQKAADEWRDRMQVGIE